jgi:hypothetical protein
VQFSEKLESDEAKRFLVAAGKSLLLCQSFESSVQHLYSGLSLLSAGKLKPSHATSLLAGRDKRSVGKLFGLLPPHIELHKEWDKSIRAAIASRNTLVHGFFRANCLRAIEGGELESVLAEVKALLNSLREGHDVVTKLVSAISLALSLDRPTIEMLFPPSAGAANDEA